VTAPRILDWAPDAVIVPEQVGPTEPPNEQVRNALAGLADLEILLSSAGQFTTERREAVAFIRRRLGWALTTLEARPKL
jgi:hypothetical protein